MKTLVTGAGGFLGRYITEQLLARGDQVRGYSRRTIRSLTNSASSNIKAICRMWRP